MRDWVKLLRDDELILLKAALVRQVRDGGLNQEDYRLVKRLLVEVSEEMLHRRPGLRNALDSNSKV